jgi:hypothetical protein
METISLQGKTNFFEKSVGEYSKSGVGVDCADQTLLLTPASDGNEHTHNIQNAYYIDQETPSNTPLSHMHLLPRLYGSKHQTCEQEVTVKSNDFLGEARMHQDLSGSVMIN